MSLPHARYGTWTSPIRAQAVAAQSLFAGVEEVILDPVTSKVYFGQKRPEENGRSAVVDASDRQDLFGKSWDARTQVHEYGGAAATVFGGVLYFSHILDHRVYKTTKAGHPVPITPVNPVMRFADFAVHPKHPDLIVCTAEDHTDPHPARVSTYLVVINAKNATVSRFVEGADFYACARFNSEGNFIVWQQWHHPELPWQSAEIKVAPVEVNGETFKLGDPVHVAGKTKVVAAQDPNWASDNTIFFTCDISGYQNPWKFVFDSGDPATGKASPILLEPIQEEFVLYICDLERRNFIEVPTPYAHIQFMRGDAHGKAVMLGQPADSGEVLEELTLDSDGQPRLNALSPRAVENPDLPSSFISPGKYYALTLTPLPDTRLPDTLKDRTCHVTYYAPKNPNYGGGLPAENGRPAEKPPVVVLVHGGPEYMEYASLDWNKQFFTSRGWAYLDINYGGSTGFGRAFRESLNGKWGLLDVEDAYQSVLTLDKMGLVDAKRAVVHGGSAGGYTTLQFATTRPTVFAAGAPHYGVSDMRKLDEVLHKFEYYLCDRLMGGTWEECQEVWLERSPIHHADKIKMPLLVLQGEKDTVVPATQMIDMVKKIKDGGGKADILLFPNEGHGWREASTIQTVLEREMLFFNEVLGLENTY
ncbi:alpha beta-hydrolase [Mycena leptocephala]|nr:alpha beta-hydrolase [Mycena leptocephala]